MPKKKVSQSDYAKHVGVSGKTVSVWKKNGLLVVTRDGGVDIERSDARLRERPAYYRGGRTRSPIGSGDA